MSLCELVGQAPQALRVTAFESITPGDFTPDLIHSKDLIYWSGVLSWRWGGGGS